jgi:hypothetical protein
LRQLVGHAGIENFDVEFHIASNEKVSVEN